ncbi:immunoglobulin I-set domain protein [Ancylostoma duodenale]|uniref:Immunoglobulin I-set domain protein n=1 Tax=Ancylostoma duodenale TaxID=51022 RepID=A0A0C2H431_9BILA|nr:immunoglobulin I-set domain protein [Ancylostoma duodenale]
MCSTSGNVYSSVEMLDLPRLGSPILCTRCCFAGHPRCGVYVVPRLVIIPDTNPVQKPAGAQIPLLCKVDGVSEAARPGIIWIKHDGLDRTGNVEVKSLDHQTMSLLIKNASSEDSGVYTCQAQIGSHLLSKTVDVIIFENFAFADKRTDIGYVMATASVNVSCENLPEHRAQTYSF